MMNAKHYKQLENMYTKAPINRLFKPKINIELSKSTIEMNINSDYFHSAQSLHGSIYFKMLDDAAFFAASSHSIDFFLITISFNTYLTKPVSKGTIKSIGKVVNKNKTQIIAESVLYNYEKIEIARGSGVFLKSKFPLKKAKGYNE